MKLAEIKKDLDYKRSLLVLLKQVFPCFHCFSKTSPSHMYTLCHINFSMEASKEPMTDLLHAL